MSDTDATSTTAAAQHRDPRYASLTKVTPRKRLTLAPEPAPVPAPAAAEPAASSTSGRAKPASGPGAAIEEPAKKQAPKTLKRPAEKRGKQDNAAAPASEKASKLERVPVRIAEDLHARLTAKTVETGLSQTGVVLAAIEAAHNANAFDFQAPGTSLFVGAAGRRRGPATSKVMIDLRPRTEDLTTIVKLMADHQAPDRTAFIIAALEHYLR